MLAARRLIEAHQQQTMMSCYSHKAACFKSAGNAESAPAFAIVLRRNDVFLYRKFGECEFFEFSFRAGVVDIDSDHASIRAVVQHDALRIFHGFTKDLRAVVPCVWRFGRACVAQFLPYRGRRIQNQANQVAIVSCVSPTRA